MSKSAPGVKKATTHVRGIVVDPLCMTGGYHDDDDDDDGDDDDCRSLDQ